MENNNKNNHQNKSPLSITKSRFKTLIDEIQTKLKRQNNHETSQTVTTLGLRSSSMNSIERGRILPYFLVNPVQRKHSKQNQKKISVNLEFNKLVLNKKNKFVQHSPNSKDLTFNLPELHISSLPKHRSSKMLKVDKTSSRWKLNPTISSNPQFITENQDLYETKNPKKFKKMINLQDDITQKQKLRDAISTNCGPNEEKENKTVKLKIVAQNSFRETFTFPIKQPFKESKNQTQNDTLKRND